MSSSPLSTRGNNRQHCFFAEEDHHFFLKWLATYAKKTFFQTHAWVLMTNHVHLLLSPTYFPTMRLIVGLTILPAEKDIYSLFLL
jgi:REP element-mobilizing transposase RayT